MAQPPRRKKLVLRNSHFPSPAATFAAHVDKTRNQEKNKSKSKSVGEAMENIKRNRYDSKFLLLGPGAYHPETAKLCSRQKHQIMFFPPPSASPCKCVAPFFICWGTTHSPLKLRTYIRRKNTIYAPRRALSGPGRQYAVRSSTIKVRHDKCDSIDLGPAFFPLTRLSFCALFRPLSA